MQMRKQRVEGLNFARAVCTISIVMYHASGILAFESAIPGELFIMFSQSPWGHIAVSAFFALSGAALYYNNEKIEPVRFYKKRIMSIFPSFYLVWAFLYLINVIKARNFFYAGRPASLLLSLLGCDGYFGGAYYIVGEWFLGAIILLYLLYPLLLKVYNTHPYIGTAVLLLAFFVNNHVQYPNYDQFRSMTTCILSFWIGMTIGKNINKINRSAILALASVDFFWHLYTGKFTFTVPAWAVLTGCSFLIFLLIVGEWAAQFDAVKKVADYISRISFQIFLVHHVVIYAFANPVQWILQNIPGLPADVTRWLVFAVMAAVILAAATIVFYLVEWIKKHCAPLKKIAAVK